MKTTLQLITAYQEKVKALETMIPVSDYQRRIAEIDFITNSSNMWEDPKTAVAIMKERQQKAELATKMLFFQEQSAFYQECVKTMPTEVELLNSQIGSLYDDVCDFEFRQMMSDPADNTPAIMTISAGAGGLEASNWVSMLLRMYLRYAEAFKFNVELLDTKHSEEHSAICIDSVSIRLDGPYAFGFFRGETGTHRLIRNSPFNANDQRHTSFAAISVSADIEDTIDIKINKDDLEITCQTAGGSGGQHQNKVSSAVRLKHLPSGIHFVVRGERSQHDNRRTAMKMLKAKLYDIEVKKNNEELEGKLSQQTDVAFGHQIRTFTLTPYQLVKDHRNECESRDADKVLDGDLHDFILAGLRCRSKSM